MTVKTTSVKAKTIPAKKPSSEAVTLPAKNADKKP